MSDEKRGEFEGLIEHCDQCWKWRELMVEMNRQLSSAILVCTRLDPSWDERLATKGVLVYGPFTVHCDTCKSTGVVLTDRGRSLVEMLIRHMPQQQADQARRGGAPMKEAEDPHPF
jgi:hypothetical protein